MKAITNNNLTIEADRVNKIFIEKTANGIIESISNGDIDVMNMATQIKAFEDVIAKIKEELRAAVLDQCNNYHVGERIIKHNGRFDVKEAGVRYDFSNCKDVEWDELNNEINRLTELRKEREKFLKALSKVTTIVDENTAEVITINPPIKTSTTTYQITWEK